MEQNWMCVYQVCLFQWNIVFIPKILAVKSAALPEPAMTYCELGYQLHRNINQNGNLVINENIFEKKCSLENDGQFVQLPIKCV